MHLPASVKIVVSNDAPPLPVPGFEWWAWIEKEDPEERSPIGYGETARAALLDFLSKAEERGLWK